MPQGMQGKNKQTMRLTVARMVIGVFLRLRQDTNVSNILMLDPLTRLLHHFPFSSFHKPSADAHHCKQA